MFIVFRGFCGISSRKRGQKDSKRHRLPEDICQTLFCRHDRLVIHNDCGSMHRTIKPVKIELLMERVTRHCSQLSNYWHWQLITANRESIDSPQRCTLDRWSRLWQVALYTCTYYQNQLNLIAFRRVHETWIYIYK